MNQLHSYQVDEAKRKVSVKDYGAKGDGVTDDRAAIQAACDYVAANGGGEVSFPSGRYRVTSPVYIPSFVHWVGIGANSFMFNDRTTSLKTGDQYCFFMGNFNVVSYGESLHFNLPEGVTQGTKEVKVLPADINNFEVGNVIQLESVTGFIGAGERFRPYYARISRIESIVGNSIFLEDTIDQTVAEAKIADATRFIPTQPRGAVDELGYPWYICQESSIKSMSFESNDYVTRRYGCYKCALNNVTFRSAKGIGGNGLAYFKVRNSRFFYTYKSIEMAMFSHNVEISGCTFTWYDGVSDKDSLARPIVKMGENVSNCKFRNNVFNGGMGDNAPVISYDHAFNNLISGNKFYCENTAQTGVDHTSNDPAGRIEGNSTLNNIFVLGNTGSYVRFSSDSGASIINNIVTGNTFSGKIIQTEVIGGDGNVVESNIFP